MVFKLWLGGFVVSVSIFSPMTPVVARLKFGLGCEYTDLVDAARVVGGGDEGGFAVFISLAILCIRSSEMSS